MRSLFAELFEHHETRLQQIQSTVENKIMELANYTELANQKAEWLNGQFQGVQGRVEETQGVATRAKEELEAKVEEMKGLLKSVADELVTQIWAMRASWRRLPRRASRSWGSSSAR